MHFNWCSYLLHLEKGMAKGKEKTMYVFTYLFCLFCNWWYVVSKYLLQFLYRRIVICSSSNCFVCLWMTCHRWHRRYFYEFVTYARKSLKVGRRKSHSRGKIWRENIQDCMDKIKGQQRSIIVVSTFYNKVGPLKNQQQP